MFDVIRKNFSTVFDVRKLAIVTRWWKLHTVFDITKCTSDTDRWTDL